MKGKEDKVEGALSRAWCQSMIHYFVRLRLSLQMLHGMGVTAQGLRQGVVCCVVLSFSVMVPA